MRTIKFNEPKMRYEVVGKNSDGDWETIENNMKTLEEAITTAKKQDTTKWTTIDINLIIDDDLVGTYDLDGNIR